MATTLNTIVNTDVVIRGTQSLNELGMLQAEAKELKLALKSITKESEEWKKLNDQIKIQEREQAKLNAEVERSNKLQEQLAYKIQKTKDEIAVFKEMGMQGTKEFKELQKTLQNLTIQSDKNNLALSTSKEKLDAVNKTTAQLNAEIKKTSKYTDDYINTTKRQEEVNKKIDETRKSLGLTGMTLKQLKTMQADLNREWENVTRGTKEYTELKTEIQRVNAVIRSQRDDLDDTRTRWEKFKDAIKGIKEIAYGNIMGDLTLQAFQAGVMLIGGSISGAAKLSDELADIRKSVGLTAKEAETLNKELGKIDTRTGSSDLRSIAKVGGQLGVAKDEILGFTQSIDRAVVALGDEFTGGAEEVAKQIGSVQKLFKDTKDLRADEAITRIGSAMNALGADGSATAPEIAEF